MAKRDKRLLWVASIIIVACIWTLIIVGLANAATVTRASGPAPVETQWLAQSRLPSGDTALSVDYNLTPCYGVVKDPGGCTNGETAIWIAGPGKLDPSVRRFIFYHEIGHVVDAQMLNAPKRLQFMQFMNLGGAWRPDTPEYPTMPSELWADSYATCARPWGKTSPAMFQTSIPAKYKKNPAPLCALITNLLKENA